MAVTAEDRQAVGRKNGLVAYVDSEKTAYGIAFHWTIEDPKQVGQELVAWGRGYDFGDARSRALKHLDHYAEKAA